MKCLDTYRQLVGRVDQFWMTVSDLFPEHIVCSKGCDACCTHIGVSTVEAMALASAVAALPEPEAQSVRDRARRMLDGEDCPLLDDGSCLLYAARPIICRTQGLPLLVAEEAGKRVDFCPENFKGLESLPGDAILDLETLNQALAAINLLCLQELKDAGVQLPERMSIADALLLELDVVP